MQVFSLSNATSDNQFGFKKGVSCSHAIHSVRKFIDRHVVAGSTVNLCAVDLSRAFDKVNQHAMFIKLMKIHVPVHLLELLENLFSGCYSYVKWYNEWSSALNLTLVSGNALYSHHFCLPYI